MAQTLSFKEIVKPLSKENIYIAGENYSNYQGWIEGALETSDNVLKTLLKSQKGGKRNKTKKNFLKSSQNKTKKIDQQILKNNLKKTEVIELKKGYKVIEQKARYELGLIKKGEIFILRNEWQD